jgi:hypothetical protein
VGWGLEGNNNAYNSLEKVEILLDKAFKTKETL